MSWQDIMRRVLPPMMDGTTKVTSFPDVTSPFGSTNRPPHSTNPHKGVDFNYSGGQQNRLNTSHPALRSPVTGIVTNAGEGTVGRIAIRDADGFTHEILHTHSRHIAVGDPVAAGQLIGSMGNTGVQKPGVEAGQFHVHYQLKDRDGNIVNPSSYFDQQAPIDPNVAPPALLKDYLQYQQSLGSTVDNAFSNAPDAGPRYGPRPVDGVTSRQPASSQAKSDVRILRSRPANAAAVSGLQIAPAATVPNALPPADRTPSFAERFGSWGSSAGVSAPFSPYQQFAPPPQSAGPLGIVTGQPMPDYPFVPPGTDGQISGLENWSGLRRKQTNWDKGD